MELSIGKRLRFSMMLLHLFTLNIKFAVKTLQSYQLCENSVSKIHLITVFYSEISALNEKNCFRYQRQADDWAPVADRDLEPVTNFRRGRNRMTLADILRKYEKKNLKEPVNEEE